MCLMEKLCRALLVALLIQYVRSYPEFRKLIPNGFSVPFPCKPGEIWPGVGHYLDMGSGIKNPFGVDCMVANNNWTEELCRKDSDGDGLTNGVELGDPDCVWKPGDIPTFPEALSHPGICDPWNSTFCLQKTFSENGYRTQQEWMDAVCFTRELDCPALNEAGIQNVSFRLPPGSSVSAKETTYNCIILDLFSLGIPTDQDFHLVAVTPILDNKRLIHHMSLFACKDDTLTRPDPYECEFMASAKCPEGFHFWTVGRNGECYHPLTGIRIGPNGLKKIAIQVHWNNPELISGLTDSSGLVLHYTSNLRPHDAGVLMIGSSLFSLPPKQPELLVHSTCASECTRQRMRGPINVTSVLNHMHYTGIKMNIEVTRDKQHVTNLTDDRAYSFYTPIIHQFSTDFVLYPGDEFHTNCIFSTLDRNKTTLSGLGARDEMCLGFISYFPRQNLAESTCQDSLGISMCNNESWGECQDLRQFAENINGTDVFQDVMVNCQSFVPCLTECVQTIVKYMTSEPCMQGRVWQYIQNMLTSSSGGQAFLSRLASCKVEVYVALNSTQGPDN